MVCPLLTAARPPGCPMDVRGWVVGSSYMGRLPVSKSNKTS